MILESDVLTAYLQETDEVNYSHPLIQQTIATLFSDNQSDIENIQLAYSFVRDHISHSWDIQSTIVTQTASQVLQNETGICYAKSNLLAALLRGAGIPTGFCYQRLMLFDTPEKGYCIHALNAVYIPSLSKWIRLDARGNKNGIQAEFCIDDEKLAFTPNPQLDEIDYPTVYIHPNKKTMQVLKEASDAIEMYQHHLPHTL